MYTRLVDISFITMTSLFSDLFAIIRNAPFFLCKKKMYEKYDSDITFDLICYLNHFYAFPKIGLISTIVLIRTFLGRLKNDKNSKLG